MIKTALPTSILDFKVTSFLTLMSGFLTSSLGYCLIKQLLIQLLLMVMPVLFNITVGFPFSSKIPLGTIGLLSVSHTLCLALKAQEVKQ